MDLVRKDLGRLWNWLPEGGLYHDAYAYLKYQDGRPNPAGELGSPVAANGAATEHGTLQAELAASMGGGRALRHAAGQ